MGAPNRALKARGKASTDRMQTDIRNSLVIINGEVSPNNMVHYAASESLDLNLLTLEPCSIPLEFFFENAETLTSGSDNLAVQIASDEFPEQLVEYLDAISMIVLPFVNFVDGRAYSHAYNLRMRYGYTGEIRAVGDVHYDQIGFLSRSGCDAFELADDEDSQAAIAALSEFSEVYQPATDSADLIFSRRRVKH